jgi:hypothetical protein
MVHSVTGQILDLKKRECQLGESDAEGEAQARH